MIAPGTYSVKWHGALLLLLASCSRSSLPAESDIIHDAGALPDASGPGPGPIPDAGPPPEPGSACTSDWEAVALPPLGDPVIVTGSAAGTLYVGMTEWDESHEPPEWRASAVLRRDGADWTTLWQRQQGDTEEALLTDLLVLHDADLILSVYSWWEPHVAQILRGDGESWSAWHDEPGHRVMDLALLEDGAIAAAGYRRDSSDFMWGLLLRADGSTWDAHITAEADDFHTLWGRSREDIYVSGWPAMVTHFTGQGFAVLPHGADSGRFFTTWPSETGVFVGGSPGLYHFERSEPFEPPPVGELIADGDSAYYDVWAPTLRDAFVGGCHAPDGSCTEARLLRVVGRQVELVEAPPGTSVYALWGRAPCELFAATDEGLFRCPCH